VFIDEGNPDKLNELINFGKMQQIAHIIELIQQYQKWNYNNIQTNFKQIPGMTAFLENVPHHNKEQLWELSLMMEPRENTS